MRTLLVAVVVVAGLHLHAQQNDLVRYSGAYVFKDGIYLGFSAFRHNAPDLLISELFTAQGRSVTDLAATNGRLQYRDSTGTLVEFHLDRTWGFCERGVVRVRAGNGFSRIGLMGSLAHLTYDATYRNLDPYMYGYGGISYTVEEQRFLDMATGAFLPVTAGGIRPVLERDPVLLEEFDALKKKQRKKPEVIFGFMRRYNDRHPLYFPKAG